MQFADASQVLAAWREQLLSDEEVAVWAGEALDAIPASDLPEWLLDLCTYGVAEWMSRPFAEFVAVPNLTFAERFAIRIRSLDVTRYDQTTEFVTGYPAPAWAEIWPSRR